MRDEWNHLGPDYQSKSEIYKNIKFEEIESLFNMTQKLVVDSLKRFWMWNAWNIHHLLGRDRYYPMIKRSSGRRRKYVSVLIPFHCWTDKRQSRSNRKMEGSSVRTQVVFVLPRCSGSMEKQLNSSGKMSKDFHHCLFFKNSNKTWREGTSSPSSRTGSSSCQCSMTLSGKRMMRIVFRLPEKSKFTQ